MRRHSSEDINKERRKKQRRENKNEKVRNNIKKSNMYEDREQMRMIRRPSRFASNTKQNSDK